MADEEEIVEEGGDEEPKSPGSGGALVQIVLTAVLSGAAAFGGAFFGAPKLQDPEAEVDEANLPGPTVPLQPFTLNLLDEEGGQHAMKITVALELVKEADPATFVVYLPRVRDVILGYLRGLEYESAKDPKQIERMSEVMLARVHRIGAEQASRVLIQDLVMQ